MTKWPSDLKSWSFPEILKKALNSIPGSRGRVWPRSLWRWGCSWCWWPARCRLLLPPSPGSSRSPSQNRWRESPEGNDVTQWAPLSFIQVLVSKMWSEQRFKNREEDAWLCSVWIDVRFLRSVLWPPRSSEPSSSPGSTWGLRLKDRDANHQSIITY